MFQTDTHGKITEITEITETTEYPREFCPVHPIKHTHNSLSPAVRQKKRG